MTNYDIGSGGSDENSSGSGSGSTRLQVSGRVVPAEIQDEPIWVLWDIEHKTPIAPWHTGHCYRAKWRGSLSDDDRPETTYKKAKVWTGIPPRELHRTHSFPTKDENGQPVDDPIPDRLGETILLPHPDRSDVSDRTLRLMYVDFDDVRDPDTGDVSAEVAEWVERLDSYTEISTSGTGVHVLVYAQLPNAIKAVPPEDLHDTGHIEIYDRSRFLGATWRHIEGTPKAINDRQEVVDALVSEYADGRLSEAEAAESGGTGESGGASGSATDGLKAADVMSGPRSRRVGKPGRRSPYYDVDLTDFANPDPIEVDRDDGTKQGAHPAHGKTTEGETSMNYTLDTSDNVWHCFAHQSGGGAMEMAAIMAGEMSCIDAGTGSLNRLNPVSFLRTCLYMRDDLEVFDGSGAESGSEGAESESKPDPDPPYRALVGVAELCDLPMRDDDGGVLGKLTHKYARKIYDDLSLADVDRLANE